MEQKYQYNTVEEAIRDLQDLRMLFSEVSSLPLYVE